MLISASSVRLTSVSCSPQRRCAVFSASFNWKETKERVKQNIEVSKINLCHQSDYYSSSFLTRSGVSLLFGSGSFFQSNFINITLLTL